MDTIGKAKEVWMGKEQSASDRAAIVGGRLMVEMITRVLINLLKQRHLSRTTLTPVVATTSDITNDIALFIAAVCSRAGSGGHIVGAGSDNHNDYTDPLQLWAIDLPNELQVMFGSLSMDGLPPLPPSPALPPSVAETKEIRDAASLKQYRWTADWLRNQCAPYLWRIIQRICRACNISMHAWKVHQLVYGALSWDARSIRVIGDRLSATFLPSPRPGIDQPCVVAMSPMSAVRSSIAFAPASSSITRNGERGSHYFEVGVLGLDLNDSKNVVFRIGVVRRSFNPCIDPLHNGWLIGSDGMVINDGRTPQPFLSGNAGLGPGDVIGLRLDFDRRTLSVWINGRYIGVACHSLPRVPLHVLCTFDEAVLPTMGGEVASQSTFSRVMGSITGSNNNNNEKKSRSPEVRLILSRGNRVDMADMDGASLPFTPVVPFPASSLFVGGGIPNAPSIPPPSSSAQLVTVAPAPAPAPLPLSSPISSNATQPPNGANSTGAAPLLPMVNAGVPAPIAIPSHHSAVPSKSGVSPIPQPRQAGLPPPVKQAAGGNAPNAWFSGLFGPSDWNCPLCTLQNKGKEIVCGACGTRKPSHGAERAQAVAQPAPQPQSQPQAVGPWSCVVCTLTNPAVSRVCSVCGSPKPPQTNIVAANVHQVAAPVAVPVGTGNRSPVPGQPVAIAAPPPNNAGRGFLPSFLGGAGGTGTGGSGSTSGNSNPPVPSASPPPLGVASSNPALVATHQQLQPPASSASTSTPVIATPVIQSQPQVAPPTRILPSGVALPLHSITPADIIVGGDHAATSGQMLKKKRSSSPSGGRGGASLEVALTAIMESSHQLRRTSSIDYVESVSLRADPISGRPLIPAWWPSSGETKGEAKDIIYGRNDQKRSSDGDRNMNGSGIDGKDQRNEVEIKQPMPPSYGVPTSLLERSIRRHMRVARRSIARRGQAAGLDDASLSIITAAMSPSSSTIYTRRRFVDILLRQLLADSPSDAPSCIMAATVARLPRYLTILGITPAEIEEFMSDPGPIPSLPTFMGAAPASPSPAIPQRTPSPPIDASVSSSSVPPPGVPTGAEIDGVANVSIVVPSSAEITAAAFTASSHPVPHASPTHENKNQMHLSIPTSSMIPSSLSTSSSSLSLSLPLISPSPVASTSLSSSPVVTPNAVNVPSSSSSSSVHVTTAPIVEPIVTPAAGGVAATGVPASVGATATATAIPLSSSGDIAPPAYPSNGVSVPTATPVVATPVATAQATVISSTPPRAAASPADVYNCHVCTLENPARNTHCSVCNTPRPRPVAATPVNTNNNNAAVATGGGPISYAAVVANAVAGIVPAAAAVLGGNAQQSTPSTNNASSSTPLQAYIASAQAAVTASLTRPLPAVPPFSFFSSLSSSSSLQSSSIAAISALSSRLTRTSLRLAVMMACEELVQRNGRIQVRPEVGSGVTYIHRRYQHILGDWARHLRTNLLNPLLSSLVIYNQVGRRSEPTIAAEDVLDWMMIAHGYSLKAKLRHDPTSDELEAMSYDEHGAKRSNSFIPFIRSLYVAFIIML
jgi:hypothetical protein